MIRIDLRRAMVPAVAAISLIAISACSSVRTDDGTGTVRGILERVVHHGAPPEEGEEPSKTNSPMPDVLLLAREVGGERADSTRTDDRGRFELRLPVGEWLISAGVAENETIPSSPPAPQQVIVTGDSTIFLELRHHIYAP